MSISGLLLFVFISLLVWIAGELMKGTAETSKPDELQPTPPTRFERGVERFIRKHWLGIGVFLVWVVVMLFIIILAIAYGAASIHAPHLPKPLPPIR